MRFHKQIVHQSFLSVLNTSLFCSPLQFGFYCQSVTPLNCLSQSFPVATCSSYLLAFTDAFLSDQLFFHLWTITRAANSTWNHSSFFSSSPPLPWLIPDPPVLAETLLLSGSLPWWLPPQVWLRYCHMSIHSTPYFSAVALTIRTIFSSVPCLLPHCTMDSVRTGAVVVSSTPCALYLCMADAQSVFVQWRWHLSSHIYSLLWSRQWTRFPPSPFSSS